MRLIAGVLLILAMLSPALAQQDGASCAAISADAERLACYDALFRAPVMAGESVVIASERLIPALPTGRKPALMLVSCEAGAVAVRFDFAGQIISATSDIAPISFQLDQSPTTIRSLKAADNSTAITFPTAAAGTTFLDSLSGGTNLKVRVTPLRQRSLTVDFRLAAHAEAIAALRESCR